MAEPARNGVRRQRRIGHGRSGIHWIASGHRVARVRGEGDRAGRSVRRRRSKGVAGWRAIFAGIDIGSSAATELHGGPGTGVSSGGVGISAAEYGRAEEVSGREFGWNAECSGSGENLQSWASDVRGEQQRLWRQPDIAEDRNDGDFAAKSVRGDEGGGRGDDVGLQRGHGNRRGEPSIFQYFWAETIRRQRVCGRDRGVRQSDAGRQAADDLR